MVLRPVLISSALIYKSSELDERERHCSELFLNTITWQVGKVASSRKGDDDEKQLRALGWQPGDVLDIAIFVREEGRPSLKRF